MSTDTNIKSTDNVNVTGFGSRDFTGSQKAALLLIALDVDTAAEVFKYIDGNDVELISAEISQVKNTPSDTVDYILREFHDMVTARNYVLEGGIEFAQNILEKSFGLNKATEIIDKVKNLTTLRGFDVLKRADSTQLINFLNKEHPQTIALILTHLSPEQTANALEELPNDMKADVAYRIATLGKVSPQTLKRIERVVDEMAGMTMNHYIGKIGGTVSLANILNRTSISFSKEILDGIMKLDPEVGANIKRQMFLFDDLINLQDRDLQRLLREIDRKDLTMSIKIVDDKLKEKIFNNMSKRASELFREELEYLGMVKLKDVEAAQARIIDVVKSLEESGELSLNIRGDGEDIYV